MARKLVVAIHKGGVGKTTTAKNLAAAFALRGSRTLLVDVDEQANATKGLGVDPFTVPTLNNLFADPDLAPAAVIRTTSVERLHLLPAHPDLAKTETGMAFQRADPNAGTDPIAALKTLLSPVEGDYDVIVFDTPPSLSFMTINAIAAADEMLIPAAASAYSEDGLKRTWEAFLRAREQYNQHLQTPRILITRVKHTNAAMAVFNGINDAYKQYVIPQLIAESTAVDEAEQLYLPVVVYDPQSTAAQGYMRVAEILTNG